MVEVGKFTLESLTTGMYSDPRIVYREYIQNSVDSIEAAISEKLIASKDAFIKIYIDAENGMISIFDNGKGIPESLATDVLLSIGKSTKRQENNRGFRGIGRLGGLSYCEQLTFITSYIGEATATKVVFNCGLLKELLSPDHEEELDLQAVVEKITTISVLDDEEDSHYFRVDLDDVDMSSELLDLDEIKQYLSEVAPVPYDLRRFAVAPEIKRFLHSHGYELTEFNIYVGYDDDHLTQVFKPNRYRFKSDRNQRTEDMIDEVVTFSIDLDVEHALLGWYGRCNWNGTLSDNSLLGMRMRLGNILIGDRRTMDVMFKEHRFNGWVQGEIFVNTTSLIPNARRDDFEQNDIYYQMLDKVLTDPLFFSYDIKSKISLKDLSSLDSCLNNISFEKRIAYTEASSEDVVRLLDYPAYYRILNLPIPANREKVLQDFLDEKFIKRNAAGSWDITNYGALMIAADLKEFEALERKTVRVRMLGRNARSSG